jgi:hypothetical protein
MRVVRAVVLEQTNTAIANRIAEISVEFAAKEVATKRLMVAERRAAREQSLYRTLGEQTKKLSSFLSGKLQNNLLVLCPQLHRVVVKHKV